MRKSCAYESLFLLFTASILFTCDFDEMLTSGYQHYIDRKLVLPGDKVVAEINILSVDHFAHQLEEGTKFSFGEGDLQLIGTGTILAVVNKRLEKQGSE